jgi:hypothetical protein
MPMTKLSALMLALAATAGCVGATGTLPLHTGAAVSFAKDASCPIEAVGVQARTDIPAHMLVSPPTQPPADVAGDPKRLVTWRNAEIQRETSTDADFRSYEVTGCGRDLMYICGQASDADLAAAGVTSAIRCFPATVGVTSAAL